MLKLLCLRHGESRGNQQSRMEGRSDTPLSARGYRQVEQLAVRLREEAWRPTHVYCSPQLRSHQTAQHLLAQLGDPDVPLTQDDRLQELDNGIFQGLTWAEACARHGDLCQRLETTLDWLPIPGAESLQNAYGRAQHFWNERLSQHSNGDRLWIISHSGLMQQLIRVILGCDRTWGIPIGPTALFEFGVDCNRWSQTGANRFNTELWQIYRFNDSQHLR